jgi:hypothetical protein
MENSGLSTWTMSTGELDFQEPETWYKGEHCHRFPIDRPLVIADILHGWTPPQRLINSGTKVLAFGSCFAEYFIAFLGRAGYNRWQLPSEQHALNGEALMFAIHFDNIFVILQQFRWAFNEFTPRSLLWFTQDKKYFEATEERREKIRESFREVDVLIITLGLSEIWFDKISDEPMWRTIPSSLYDPERHIFRAATAEETVQAFYALDRLIDEFLPGKRFIFTLSPIPLAATFRDQSPITANQVSKATLRTAIDQFVTDPVVRAKGRYHYFPSYELVLHLFDRPFLPDNRHLRPEVAAVVLDIFSAFYTDLPVMEPRIPKREDHIDLLEHRVRELELQISAKEQVIQELAREAGARLEIINRLATGPK